MCKMVKRVSEVVTHVSVAQFDRWLLLRASMLWRTRFVYLFGLTLFVVAELFVSVDMDIKDVIQIPKFGNDIVLFWRVELLLAIIILITWVWVIIRCPVGELPLRRHVVTIVFVGIGSYLLIVTPTVFANRQISAIAGVNDRQLASDRSTLSQYAFWNCVPEHVFSEPDLVNQNPPPELKSVLDRYNLGEVEFRKRGDSGADCGEFVKESGVDGNIRSEKIFAVEGKDLVALSNQLGFTMTMINDARNFEDGNTIYEFPYKNQFAAVEVPAYLWLLAALAIGLIAIILSYPFYVWRRLARVN